VLKRSLFIIAILSSVMLMSCFLTQPRVEPPSERPPFGGMISPGDSREGTLQGSGKAYFTVVVQSPGQVSVAADATGSPCDPLLEIQDALGAVLARDDNGGGGMNARISVYLNPGRYAIVLYNNSPVPGPCRLSVMQEAGTALPGGQQPDSQARPPVQQGSIGYGETRAGTLNRGDQHAWTFNAAEPGPVTIDMKNAGSPLDSYLKLLDPQKNIIAQDDDGGGGVDARIVSEVQRGTYTIIALPYGSSTGTYRLSLTKGALQAQGQGQAIEPKTVEKGELAIGRRVDAFMAPGERHVYGLKLEKKESLAIDANRVTQGMDPVLELDGPGGESIAKDDDGGGERNASIMRGLEKGAYRVTVSGFNNNGGAYRLYVSRVRIEAQKHTTLEPGVVREANLGPADSHRYTFSVKKQAMAEIDLKSADGMLDPMLELRSADGRVLGQDDDGGGNRDAKIVQYLEPGNYEVAAKAYQGSMGRYRLSLNFMEVRPQEHTDITPGVTREGWIFPGKIHNYDLRLTRKSLVSIDAVTGDGRFDPMLSLQDAQGQALGNDDDGGGASNARLLTELGPGSYRVGVLGYGGNSSGKYSLSVRELEMKAIAPGETREGTLEDKGNHVYAFELRDTSIVTIDGKRADASQFDPYLTLIAAGKGLVARDDDGGGESNAKITSVLEPGRYFIALTGYNNSTGRYALSLERKDVPPPVDARISVGDRRQGFIYYPAQRDRYTFTLQQAAMLTITMQAENSRLDTFLEVYDAQNNMLNSDDDGGGGTNSRMQMQFAPGTYTVVARSYNNSMGAYVLEVRQ
jgi:hypothetical protein